MFRSSGSLISQRYKALAESFAQIFADPKDLADYIKKYRSKLGKIVFTNGCFDLLHRGHVEYLSRAKSLGDILVVGLNSDSSVQKLKGPSRPLQNQSDRAYILAGLRSVDFVTVFFEETPVRTISLIRPDIHAKGGDYKADQLPEAETVKSYGGSIEIIPFVPGKSTTSIVERMS